MPPAKGQPAARVAAGILVTRILGFVRERVFAHYFGSSAFADAYRAALRIPGVIRNLLGEGTLSASFIPVYARMLARGDEEDARRLAGTVISFLLLITILATGAGVLLAPVITDLVAPGFDTPRRDLTIRLVRILFPMGGVLILSAWCLGILNTHGRFFLSYAAPSLWNIAQITALVALGGSLVGAPLVMGLAVGALLGSLLQLLVQLPSVLGYVRRIDWSLDRHRTGVTAVFRAWGPVVAGAGVVQISGVVDTQLASLLGGGAVAVLGYAQLVAVLPVSLFGVSVAAAALPDLARDAAGADTETLRNRLSSGAARLAYYVFPSAFAFALLAVPIIATLFQTGRFDENDTAIAAGVLAAYAIGLFGQATVKLFASGFYAIGDTRTPVRIAALSVTVSAGLAVLLMQVLGPAGIALGAATGAYVNVFLLAKGLSRRVGPIIDPSHRKPLAAILAGVVLASAGTEGLAWLAGSQPAWVLCLGGLAAFGLLYGFTTLALGHPEAHRIVDRLTARAGR